MQPSKHQMDGQDRAGLSLPEVLVVIGLIGLLMGLTLQGVQSARASAARASCTNRMRQIGLALHQHHDATGRLPAGTLRSSTFRDSDPEPGLSWLTKVLPYVEQEALAREARLAYRMDPIPWNNPPHTGLAVVVPLFICPADSRLTTPLPGPSGQMGAFTSYLGVSAGFTGQNNGVLGFRPGIRLTDIIDGTSQTLMLGERPPSADLGCGWWYAPHPSLEGAFDADLPAESSLDPYNTACGGHAIPTASGIEIKFVFSPGRITNPCDKYHFWSLHPGGANFLFADGSVHFLPYNASPIVRALATRAGGESVTLPD